MEKVEKRILVVDDDDAIRSLLVTVLRRRGFGADTARDGAEALACLDRCSYSLMLLDFMMPRPSGPEVLRHLSTREPSSRPIVIVLTAGNDPRDLDPSTVSATIRKPFDIEVLIETIVACLNAVDGKTQLESCRAPLDSEGSGGRVH